MWRVSMAGRLRALVPFTQAAAVMAAAVSVCAFGAGPVSAAGGARPTGGGLAAISCASAGSCAAVGILFFGDAERPLVVSEKNGAWGTATTIPGLSALPGGERFATLTSVSCSSAGNCGAGGEYVQNGTDDVPVRALVVTERDGIWGKAKAVGMASALNAGGTPEVDWISCRSAGNCTAFGKYLPKNARNRRPQVFVASEKNGTWGKAGPVPGLAAIDHGLAIDTALSCASPGNCTVAGYYDAGTAFQGYAATQKNGAWSTVHSFGAIAAGVEGASIDQLSCQPGGNCTGTGTYFTAKDTYIFAVNEAHGTWGAGRQIAVGGPGGGITIPQDTSLTCWSAGNCAAGGTYNGESDGRAWVATETHGTWSQARVLPGVAALKDGSLGGLACFLARNCAAAGSYAISAKTGLITAIFVTAEKNGRWAKPERVPGSAALSTQFGQVMLSCGAPGNCSIGGNYSTEHSDESFVATEKNGTWGKAESVPGMQP
jgi:hypothetical protein